METKIKGLKIEYSIDEFTIFNSYQISSINKMKLILKDFFDKNKDIIFDRKISSLINQWITYNFFYKIFLFRKHTKNCRFKEKPKKITSILCFLFSRFKKIRYKIVCIKNYFKIKKKTKLYKKYIQEHQANIEKAYEEMKENSIIYQRYNGEILDALWERVLVHDKSKYSDEEFIPYRKNFYPINAEEKENNKQDFEKAWEHHWKNNSHHWQYRKNKTSFDKDNKEEVLDVLENILDWIAMGYKFNDRPYQYYENNKNNITLCDDERKYLEDLIYNVIDIDYIAKEDSNDDGTRK